MLRVLSIFVVLGIAIWIVWPQGVDASSRTYTAEYVPDRIADGFDFPVGKNGSAAGYYMARKMTPFGHLGDDWNGVGGGNSDYGDPIYSIADGVVVYSENFGSNWGQVIIVRHKYREVDGIVRKVDSLYGHVINRRVSIGDSVRRGQQIAQIGNSNGMYLAHLHLEIRSNTDIGIAAWNFSKGLSNYHRPDQFIARHRPGTRVDPGLRLASAEPTPKEKEPVTQPEPVTVASVTSVESSPVVEQKPTPIEDAPHRPETVPPVSKPMLVTARDSREASKAELALFTRAKKSPKVVDELASPVKRSRNEDRDFEKAEHRPLFGGGGRPERDRRSRKPSRDRDEEASSPVKSAAARRRNFGKQ